MNNNYCKNNNFYYYYYYHNYCISYHVVINTIKITCIWWKSRLSAEFEFQGNLSIRRDLQFIDGTTFSACLFRINCIGLAINDVSDKNIIMISMVMQF